MSISWAVDGDGYWDEPGNWSGGAVPTANDDVVIDRPGGDFTITIRSGTQWAKSLESEENLVIASGASLSMNGTLANAGQLTVGGDLRMNNRGLDNQAGALLDLQHDAAISSVAWLSNAGTLRKSAGSGTLTIGGGLYNVGGAIDVQAGTLAFEGTGTSTGGAFTAALGATLDLAGTQTVTGDFTGSGAGAVLHSRGTLTVGAEGATFDFAPGLFRWTGGSIDGVASGPDVLRNEGSMTIAGDVTLSWYVQLDNAGTIVHQSGNLSGNNNHIYNLAGAVYDFQGDATIGASNGSLNNYGTVRKTSGIGAATITRAFNNLGGVIDVQTGTLAIEGAGTGTGGVFTAASGATLDLAGTQTLTGTYTGSGQGTVLHNRGILRVGAQGATFNFSPGLFQWTGGSVDGVSPGPDVLRNVGTITVAGNVTLDWYAQLDNAGTIAHISGNLSGNNSTLNNLSGGIYDFQGDATIGASNYAMNNYGTVRKTAGAGAATVTRAFNNLGGTIDVQTGTLAIEGAGTSTGGVFTAASGATLDLAGTQTLTGTYTGSGAGTVLHSRGTLVVGAAGATFDFAPGLLRWTGGAIQGVAPGPDVLRNIGTIAVAGNVTLDWYLQLDNAGTIAHTSGNLSGNNSTLNNLAGGVYDFQGDAAIGASNYAMNNYGTVRKTAGAGTTTITRAFNNLGGTVDVQTGTLAIEGAGTSTGGVFTAASGATLDLAGTQTLTGTYTGSGAGTVLHSRGTLVVGAAGATFNFPSGLFQWTGGNIVSTERNPQKALTNLGTITLAGDAWKWLDTVEVHNTGIIAHAGSGGLGFRNATLNNLSGGLYDFQWNVTFGQVGDWNYFNNAGTVRKSAGAGTAATTGVYLNNAPGGVIEVQSGTLALTRGGNSTGGHFRVDAGAVLDLTGGYTNNLIGNYTGEGDGSVVLWSGELSIGRDGATFDFPPGMFQWMAGTINGADPYGVDVLTNLGTITLAANTMGIGDDKSIGGINGITLNNAGTIVHQSGRLVYTNTTMNNQSGGVYDFQADASIVPGSNGIINNAGLFLKSAGFGTSAVNRPFNNTGTVEVRAGTLSFPAGVTQVSGSTLTGGAWNALDGILSLSGGLITVNQANVTIAGDSGNFVNLMDDASGTESLLNQGSLTLLGDLGTTWRRHSLTNEGSLVLGPGARLPLEGDGAAGSYVQTAAGLLTTQIGPTPTGAQSGGLTTRSASLDGTLNIELVDGFGPTAGQVFELVESGSRSGAFATVNGLRYKRFLLFELQDTGTLISVRTLLDAPDLAAGQITLPANAAPGQLATIGYTVDNLSDYPAAGPWTDSVYLSEDLVLDPSDKLFGRVEHPGEVAGRSSYVESVTAPIPAVAGAYRAIVVSDSRGLVPDVNRANNTSVSDAAVTVTVPELPLETLVSATIADGRDVYYRMDLAPGQDMRLKAEFTASGEAEFYVRYGQLPDRSTFDQAAPDIAVLSQELLLAAPQGGTYYILLHGREGAGEGTVFSLRADPVAFGLRSVTPDRGSNGGQVTVTLVGSHFVPGTLVRIDNDAIAPRDARSVRFKDANTLFATFDLVGLAPGVYDVIAEQSGETAVLAGAFTVIAGEPSNVDYELIAPKLVRTGREGRLLIEYVNAGQTDAVAPLMILSSDNARFQFTGPDADTTEWIPDRVELLGINHDGPAGILPPGARGTIELKFAAKVDEDHVDSTFSLYAADDPTRVIQWNDIEESMRPSLLSADAWDAVFDNFTAQVGNTIGQYQAALAENATYLSQLGEYTPDVRRLEAFELQKANAFGAITNRYALGGFGRGVLDPMETEAVVYPGSGDFAPEVIAVGLGDQYRVFIDPDPLAFANQDGEADFVGRPGDPGTLNLQVDAVSLPGGEFAYYDLTATVREADGITTVFSGSYFPDTQPAASLSLKSITDTNGNWINRVSDEFVGFEDSFGDRITYSAAAGGRVTQITDPVGRATDFTYDAAGEHLLSIAAPDGTVSFTYVTGQGAAREHALESITYADGTHQYFQYDDRGRLVRATLDGGASPITCSYDTSGAVTVTDADGAQATYYLNEFAQVARIQNPLGEVVQGLFDRNHNLTRLTAPGGATTTFEYDNRFNLARIVGPAGGAIDLSYDAAFNGLTSLRDEAGNVTRYGHDDRGNTTSVVQTDGSAEQFGYDEAGNVTQWTKADGRPIHYTYDSKNLLVRKDLPDGTHVDYTYDDHRNLVTATDAAGTTRMDYDAADRLTKVTYANGRFLQYAYDGAGRRIQMTDQGGFTVNYSYDALGRLSELTDAADARIAAYAYDDAGRLARKDLGNGTYATYVYDAAGQRTSLVNHAPDDSVLSRFDYTYNELGLPVSMTTLDGTSTYTYDAAGQLASVALPGGRTIAYQYDAAGNRVSVIDGGVATPYTTNNLNQVTAVGGAAYSYDADGQLVAKTDATGTASYTYDVEGRLVAVVGPQGAWTYEYDALGNRVATVRNGERTEYLLDPTGLGDVVGEYDAGGGLVAHYTYGLGLASQVDAVNAAAYYAFDGTGNTSDLTGAQGAILNQYSYLPFGEPLAATGTASNPFTYVGQFGVMSGGADLYFMRNRWYDPSMGRFTSRDPLGHVAGDANLYRYVHNSPIDSIDPTGLQEKGTGLILPEGVEQALDHAQTGFGGFLVVGGAARVWTAVGMAQGLAVASTASGVAVGSALIVPVLTAAGGGASIGTGIDFLEGKFFPEQQRNRAIAMSRWFGMDKSQDVLDSDVQSRVRDHGGQDAYLQDRMNYHRSQTSGRGRPGDPNDIIGPAGFGTEGFLNGEEALPYTIRFENRPVATAPAQVVVVTEQLDADLEWSTFELGDLGFASQTVDVPEERRTFSTRVDDRAVTGVFVDVAADINLSTGLVTWTFTSISPATLDIPDDAAEGFLPPNQTAPQGEGWLTYRVRPKSGLATGTRLDALATIVFDEEAPLDTPPIYNTIDSASPSSGVESLPEQSRGVSIVVSWSGSDDAGGSGIANYDVYVSDNAGPYQLWLPATTQTSATFTGELDHTYRFYSIATDNVGRQELPPGTHDAQVTLLNNPPVAVGDVYSVDQGTALNIAAPGVLQNDEDADGHALVATKLQDPAHGALELQADGSFLYTPQAGFRGVDTFSYQVNDGRDDSQPATVTIYVNPVVQLPGGRGTNSVVVQRSGDNLRVVNNTRVLVSRPLNSLRKLTILGAADKPDTVSVNLARGGLAGLVEGIVFDGGAGALPDVLRLRGTGRADAFRSDADSAAIGSLAVQFANVEQLTLDGGAGNDAYQVSDLGAKTVIIDSMGTDALDFSEAAVGVDLDLGKALGQTQEIFASNSATLALKGTLEKVIGTPQDDFVKGNASPNRIEGRGGNDTLYGRAGNDWLYGGPGDDWLYGGDGNDKLYGESGNNLLVGGAGDDRLDVFLNADAAGRNLLIGGLGADTLQGGPGEEILIGGTTGYDYNLAALAAVMREWTSDKAYDARCAKLDAGFDHLLAGFVQLKRKTKADAKGTVIDDGVRDKLFGGEGDDWLFGFPKDDMGNGSPPTSWIRCPPRQTVASIVSLVPLLVSLA